MDKVFFDIALEYESIIEEISARYGYDEELLRILRKILPAMLEGANYEERQLFYKMLLTTPIISIGQNEDISKQTIINKYMGNVNPHVDDIDDTEKDEYEKIVGDAKHIIHPVFDKAMNLVGCKRIICIRRKELDTDQVDQSDDHKSKLFGTNIDVVELIHELGHAWVAEKDGYKKEGNIVTIRIGTSIAKFEIGKKEDGRYTIKMVSREGILTEEALNTKMQLDATARYLGISRTELDKLYASGFLIESSYHGAMLRIIEELSETKLARDVRQWRIMGNQRSRERISDAMSHSPIYINRTIEREDEIEKNRIFNDPENENIAEFCRNCKNDFCVDKSSMTPIQLFDLGIKQCFDVNLNKLKLPFNIAKKMCLIGIITSYSLVHDAEQFLSSELSQDAHVSQNQ